MSENNFVSSSVYYNNPNELGLVLVKLTNELGSFWTEYKKQIVFEFDYNDLNESDSDYRVNVFFKFNSDEDVDMFRKLYRTVRKVLEGSENIGSYTTMVSEEDPELEDEVMFG